MSAAVGVPIKPVVEDVSAVVFGVVEISTGIFWLLFLSLTMSATYAGRLLSVSTSI